MKTNKFFIALAVGVIFLITSIGMASACSVCLKKSEADYNDYGTFMKNNYYYVPYLSSTDTFVIYQNDELYLELTDHDLCYHHWKYDGSQYSSGVGDVVAPYRFTASGNHVITSTQDYLLWTCDSGSETVNVKVVPKNNDYPVVLVHGFAGWGRNEMGLNLYGDSNPDIGFIYWGGQAWGSAIVDIEKTLNNRGYKVYTASVGPVSSVYDRACDLWAQLKGGDGNQALYGTNHAAQAGTTEYPHAANSGARTYNNLTRTWNGGTQAIGAVNASNPIHLIGHSMGGQTVRMLAGLLEVGSPWGDSDIWPGGQMGYIRSITTAATPHNGTSLTHMVGNITNVLNDWGINWLKILTGENVVNTLAMAYGLDIEQWTNGLSGAPCNITVTNLTTGTCMNSKPAITDLSLWDLSPCGAMYDLNTRPQMVARPDIYYFSYSCMQSDSSGNADASNLFGVFTAASWNTNANLENAGLTGDWHYHDGVVNTISAAKPSCDQFTDTKESSDAVYSVYGPKGKWYHIDMLHEDHMDVVGGFLGLGTETMSAHDPWDLPGHDHAMTDTNLNKSSWGTTGKIHGEHMTLNNPTIYDFWQMQIDRLQRLPAF
ncbi:MAG: hypothetical protein HQK77_13080 [Desulfobacterales bacterium]|nr:hypothetical protein [Desulfobacterales bacterium]